MAGPGGEAARQDLHAQGGRGPFPAGVEVEIDSGTYLDPGRSRVTVGDWATAWLGSQAQLKPSTLASYESILRVRVLPTWGAVPLGKVGHAEVAAWAAGLRAGGLSASSVRQAHRVLSLVLDLAVRDRRIPANPAAGVPLPRLPQGNRRYLSHEQVASLAGECGQYRTLVLVLAYCGLRFGEAAALRVRHVDPLRGRLEVVEAVTEIGGRATFGTPKTHQRRSVPVPAFLRDELGAQLAGKAAGDLVFTAPGGGVLRATNFRRRAFDRAAWRAGLDGLVPHELRHTAASLAISAGASVKGVQLMLGHASAAMTLDVYAGLFGDDLDAVAERLDTAARAHVYQMCTGAPVTRIDSRRTTA